ncbi:MAG: hypothetical protein NT166_00100 [Candidatus Aminicenantes bacterium]|nr:hypothetical protein [Candidatus Aminicenantes bacterium]
MQIHPRNFLKSIINCFGNHPPKSIIVGGSYATGEACRYYYKRDDLWMSDFDLLCIDNIPYEIEETRSIYKNMWQLSKYIHQANPYFHIGLKLRTPVEWLKESDSMYCKELLETGSSIKGPSLDAYMGKINDITFDSLPEKKRYQKLYNWGLTRLWSNILFFPIRAVGSTPWEKGRLWYSYFVARGAMDWLTWQLMEQNCWAPSYHERFQIWENRYTTDKKTKLLLKQCLKAKLGYSIVDVKEIFSPIVEFSSVQMERYSEMNFENRDERELKFVKVMLKVIKSVIDSDDDFSPLQEATSLFEGFSTQKMGAKIDYSWEYWHHLRIAYNYFRFKCDPLAWKDHEIYTNYFLQLGSP